MTHWNDSDLQAHLEDDLRIGAFSMEYELPEEVLDDPRLGKPAIAPDGCTGIVDHVWRFSDGYESIHIMNEKTGLGHGGEVSQFTIFE